MISEVQRQLLDILACQLFGKPRREEQDTDWQALLKEARQQAVFSLVYHGVENDLQDAIPAEQRDSYALWDMQCLVSSMRNAAQHGELHKLLTENRVPYVILKGMASAAYYPEPLLRAMGDVDFLVAPDQVEAVDALLRNNGYEKDEGAEKHIFHWEYRRGKEIAELHWQAPGVPTEDPERFSTALQDIVEKACLCTASETEFMAPSPFHHGLALLLHTAGHLTSGGVGLRHLCDWLVFENSLPEDRFLALFEKPLREMGLWTFAGVLTDIGIRYLGCEERQWCREVDRQISDKLINDILDGGNFGRKDKTRGVQATMIRDTASREIEKDSLFRVAFSNIDRKARSVHPICERHPILRPLFWAGAVLQHLYHVLTGQGVHLLQKDVLHGAKERKALYSELHLFQKK